MSLLAHASPHPVALLVAIVGLVATSACASAPRPAVEAPPHFEPLAYLPSDPDVVVHLQLDRLHHSESGSMILSWLDQAMQRETRGLTTDAPILSIDHVLEGVEELWVAERSDPGGNTERVLVARTDGHVSPSLLLGTFEERAAGTWVAHEVHGVPLASSRDLDLNVRGIRSIESAELGVWVDLIRVRDRSDVPFPAEALGFAHANSARLELHTSYGLAAQWTVSADPDRVPELERVVGSRLEGLRHEPLVHFLHLDDMLDAATVQSDMTTVSVWSTLTGVEATDTLHRADRAIRDVIANGADVWHERVVGNAHPLAAGERDPEACAFVNGMLTRVHAAEVRGADVSRYSDALRQLRQVRDRLCL